MYVCMYMYMSFPGSSAGEESACNVGDLGLILGWEDPLEERMTTPPVCLPGESHGQISLVSYSSWGPKELDTTEQLSRAYST